jgi:hydroxymethylglutaryl-CoA lyase
MLPESVELVEVSPRDGLQSVVQVVPTAEKIRLIENLYATGLRRIEVTSFVSPSALPQMADAAEIVAAAQQLPGLDASVLVPTLRHAERALDADARHLVFVLSVSEAHNRSNVRRSPAESAEEYERIVARMPIDRLLRLNVATAFDCPMDGRVSDSQTLDLLDRLVPMAKSVEIALCDTTGRASPAQVRRLFDAAKARFPTSVRWAFHGHDTYGLGTTNVFAALEAGVDVIDASCSALGGCPFAPGATGNVATEDVIWMLDAMGIATGVDVERLSAVAETIATIPGAQTGGRVRAALAANALRLARKKAEAV